MTMVITKKSFNFSYIKLHTDTAVNLASQCCIISLMALTRVQRHLEEYKSSGISGFFLLVYEVYYIFVLILKI
jgi:hypothetical protein